MVKLGWVRNYQGEVMRDSGLDCSKLLLSFFMVLVLSLLYTSLLYHIDVSLKFCFDYVTYSNVKW